MWTNDNGMLVILRKERLHAADQIHLDQSDDLLIQGCQSKATFLELQTLHRGRGPEI